MTSSGGKRRAPFAPDAATRASARADPSCTRDNFKGRGGSNAVGARFEARALEFLQRQRLRFVARNVRCRGGELDLVMREPDGTLVFVEVRARTRRGYDGAAASVGWRKRGRLLHAAQHFLAGYADEMPACRFDVIAFDSGRLVWLRDAFRADDR
ncbi:YraN family protein [Paraburkholderia caballeronis]|uniref:UPF0102 protein SAMN05192542_102297 n=1 Tax=Paraburkholderia caballeronis TaxID=416943 RepID=A0A1H7HIT4_9BURK|nr:YraN family protein [Paraburkholderia caballeronis]PXW29484.1 putative endonuclease [Paraburkholderia caballeronis]PXX04743.1 putative endonuclease [Paraburkholderia caballeronis]RAK05804.1 putative endonuclease [Paraburkholderia caballeronis]SEB40936.1 putative endonuclease [Paraburkholderia caballeronis]SEK50179.1 putative endonuclease [Paraburkholderia caballeronis]